MRKALFPVIALILFQFYTSLSFAESVIHFTTSMGADPEVSGKLEKGSTVAVQYERRRFYELVDRSLARRSGVFYSPGTGYSIAYHCYGYGCCSEEFPEIFLFYRFKGTDVFQSVVMKNADSDSAILAQEKFSVPADAEKFEIYFMINQWSLTTWVCGGEGGQADRATRSITEQLYDSKFGANFSFSL